MNIKLRSVFAGSLLFASQLQAETLPLPQALQRAVDQYLPLQVAKLRTERSDYEKDKIESSLGWQLQSQTAFSHDVGFTGTPSDKLTAGGGISRLLPNGDTVGGNAAYSVEDSEFVFGPSFPNPAHRLNLDLNYRKPLWQGADNPDYSLGLARAEINTELDEQSELVLRDSLANQVIEIYYNIALTQASIENNNNAKTRTRRLMDYIKNNQSLGLAEEKDILQVEAQMQSLIADASNLQLILEQQQVLLNQLLNQDFSTKLTPVLTAQQLSPDTNLATLVNKALENSHELRIQDARVRLAELTMDDVRNSKKDKLDVLVSAGTRSAYGDNSLNETINEHDLAFSVGVEFSQAMDKRGVDAQLSQAMLDRTIALREIENIKRDLTYQVHTSVREIRAAANVVKETERRVNSEQRKYNEASQRYKRGRTTTVELIQFENDFSLAKFLLEQKRIDLAKRHSKLQLLVGSLWNSITLADNSVGTRQ